MPVQPIKQPENNPDFCRELKSNYVKPVVALARLESEPKFSLEKLIDPCKYSRIGTILRVTAYVLRFIRNLQRCRKNLAATESSNHARKGKFSGKDVDSTNTGLALKDEGFKKVKQSLSLFEDV